jgi:hypothetical protein
MNRERLKRHILPALVLSVSLWPFLSDVGGAQDRTQAGSEQTLMSWQSPAKLRHLLGGEKGSLTIGAKGIKFWPSKGPSMEWAFQDVQTFRLSAHSLTIETYRNRKRHLPGIERYRFDLGQAVPPSIAAELAREVQRPSQNVVPYSSLQGIVVAAHHKTLTGGTNGVLRLSDDGIAYVTSSGADSRSWRWADLQTVSNPDPWHFFVFGYRDTYEFDLKGKISRQTFNHISDEIWAHNESELRGDPAALAPGTHRNDGRRKDE